MEMVIRVEKDGGDFCSVQEAVNAVPYGEKARIEVGEGTFREKIFCEKKDIEIVGAGVDRTIIDFDDYANEIMQDGAKRGTFRTYTAFFGGERVCVRDMTIRNSAGDGRVVGQAVAVYADASICEFENVRMVACQDTLFCAPLPYAERSVNGFIGPRVFAERKLTRQYFKGCEIRGDVDFIFGGADAVFDDCTIICNDRVHVTLGDAAALAGAGSGRPINGYITAGCGLKDGLGFVFRNCKVGGAEGCEPGSVFLGRPWREEARTVFLNCEMDESIAPERFSGWSGIDRDEPNTFYGEFGSRTADGAPADLSCKNPWVRDIDESLAKELSARADDVVKLVTNR